MVLPYSTYTLIISSLFKSYMQWASDRTIEPKGAVSLTLTRLHLAEVPLPTAPLRLQGFATQPRRLSGRLCKSGDLRGGDPG